MADVPKILTMIWGEDDSVWVELKDDPAIRARLQPGDSYSWTPPTRPHLAFTIALKEVTLHGRTT